MSETYLRPKQVQEMFGVSATCLKKWRAAGKIQCIYTPGGQARYILSSLVGDAPEEKRDQRSICYARVSTREQKEDLERQVEFFRSRYPNHEIIRDIGSGLNFKRKGFKAILDAAIQGNIREVVVTHKDRFCRYGFELFEHILESRSKGKFVVLNDKSTSPQEELINDLVSIITVFSSRLYGLRSHQVKRELQKLVQEAGTNEDSQVQIGGTNGSTEEGTGVDV